MARLWQLLLVLLLGGRAGSQKLPTGIALLTVTGFNGSYAFKDRVLEQLVALRDRYARHRGYLHRVRPGSDLAR
jgi:hypothetical protein